MDYQEKCFQAKEVVKEAAAYIRGRHVGRGELNIEIKGRQNYVTEVDKEAEHMLVNGLQEIVPEAGFIAEEGTSNRREETYNWVIDPLDGTTNFIHGAYPFAISVALIKGGSAVLGIIYEFGLDEYFYSWKGGGAWLNGIPIHVSSEPSIQHSLIATGFPYTNFTYMREFMDTIDYFMRNSHGLRRLGSAATDIAWVACGRYDGFYEYGLHPWDIAAGVLLVSEAGGKVSDFSGDENVLFQEEIICSNRHNHQEFLDTIMKIMPSR